MLFRSPILGDNSGFGTVGARAQSVYLYESPSSTSHFSRVGGNYENLLSPWRTYFSDRARAYKAIKSVSQLQELKDGVLVLPSALALGEPERVAIAAFRARGGSVLATWATGTRDASGEWVGWSFLEQLGVSNVSEIPTASLLTRLVLNGEMPVSYSHGAGQSIALGKAAEPLLAMQGSHIAARFMGSDHVISADRQQEGAVLYSESKLKASRAVVFAFAESTWEAKPFATQLIIDDALKWLSHDVSVIKAAWPQAKRSAQVIQVDAGENVSKAPEGAAAGMLDLATLLQAAGYPATAFLTSAFAKDEPTLALALEKVFEIGYHGDVLEGLKGVDPATQRKRLDLMRVDLARVLPRSRSALGFRAPLESYSANTEQIIQQMGIRYHGVEPNRFDDRIPHFAKLPELLPKDDLLLLPRSQRDDIKLLAQGLSVEQLSSALITDFDFSFETGALGWLSLHGQNLGLGSPMSKSLAHLVKHTKTQTRPVWYANAGQIDQWWRDRERVKVSSQFNGKLLDLSVTVTGDSSVSGAGLVVMLPAKGLHPIVRAAKVGTELPQAAPVDEFRWKIVFAELKPGNYNYAVAFETR